MRSSRPLTARRISGWSRHDVHAYIHHLSLSCLCILVVLYISSFLVNIPLSRLLRIICLLSTRLPHLSHSRRLVSLNILISCLDLIVSAL